jgi:hypothetical protein
MCDRAVLAVDSGNMNRQLSSPAMSPVKFLRRLRSKVSGKFRILMGGLTFLTTLAKVEKANCADAKDTRDRVYLSPYVSVFPARSITN